VTQLRKAYEGPRRRGIVGSVKWFVGGIGALATSAIVTILVVPTAVGAATVCGGPISSVTPNHGTPGTKLTIKGSNFLKGGTSHIEWELTYGGGNGDTAGSDTNPAVKNATIVAHVPSMSPGRYWIDAEGNCGSQTQTTWSKQFLVQ
jgi:hypothetical protein